MSQITTSELRKVIALSDLPEEHLQWILERGELKEYEDGEMVIKFGDPVDDMWFVIEGKSHFYLNVNGKLVFSFTFENEAMKFVAGMIIWVG